PRLPPGAGGAGAHRVQGAVERVGRAQAALLRELLDARRMRRMSEFEALAGRPDDVYALADMLADVRRGVWSELSLPAVRVDLVRRNLQRSYLEAVRAHVAPRTPAAPAVRRPGLEIAIGALDDDALGDERALLRGELRALAAALRAALPRAADRTTRLHIEDARLEIERMLEGDGS